MAAYDGSTLHASALPAERHQQDKFGDLIDGCGDEQGQVAEAAVTAPSVTRAANRRA
ncbi:hypothetical protein ACPA9J_03635 [Pseudomonas aeruginosa]